MSLVFQRKGEGRPSWKVSSNTLDKQVSLRNLTLEMDLGIEPNRPLARSMVKDVDDSLVVQEILVLRRGEK